MQFLARYAQCAKACLEHILEKTRLGKDLVEKFDTCRATTDLLKPMIANIQMGSPPKSDGTNLGKTVLEQQEILKQAILLYFSTPGTASQIADWPLFAQCFVPNLRLLLGQLMIWFKHFVQKPCTESLSIKDRLQLVIGQILGKFADLLNLIFRPYAM